MIKFRPISHNVREFLPLLPDYLEKDKDIYLTYLFGSFASGKVRKLSDVDIAVLLKEGIEPLEKQLNLLAEITFILKTDEVDLVILNRAPISLQYTIISEGKLLVNREDKLRRDYEEKVSQDYLDSEYMRTEHQKYLFQRIKGESSMIDKNVIARRLAQLEKNIRKLRKIASTHYEEFVWDEDTLSIAERNLQVAIQICLDIGNHIISALGLREPESYGDIFTILSEAGILPKEFTEKIRGMAGLRNILVHEYLIIEPAQIYKHLQRVNDFQEYARYIVEYMEKLEEEKCP